MAKPKTMLPEGTKFLRGEVLSTKKRANEAATRDKRRVAMYAAIEAHPESADEIAARVNSARQPAAESPKLTKMRRAVRKAERQLGDGTDLGGTGQTVIKSRFSPIARLISEKRIGREELDAADEILKVFMAVSGGLLSHSALGMLDRIGGSSAASRHAGIDGEDRYRSWAGYWSNRAKRGDPTLAIVIAAVIDEHPLRAIEQDRRLRHGRAADAVVNGLRNYAARAGWVDRHIARAWFEAAESLFKLRKAA